MKNVPVKLIYGNKVKDLPAWYTFVMSTSDVSMNVGQQLTTAQKRQPTIPAFIKNDIRPTFLSDNGFNILHCTDLYDRITCLLVQFTTCVIKSTYISQCQSTRK